MAAAELVQDLLSDDKKPAHQALSTLSDLDPAEYAELERRWGHASTERKRLLLRRLRDLAEENVEYTFKRVFLLALEDRDAGVRADGVLGLWEEEGVDVLDRLLALLHQDRTPEVRAAAVESLGRYALLGAVGRLDASRSEQLEETLRRELLAAHDGSELQMRALESLSYYGEDPRWAPIIDEYIARLYREGDEPEQEAALVAMGRSMHPRWHGAIQQELGNEDPQLRLQAARAAGEGVLKDAVSALARLARGDEPEVRQAAVWSLGQIGTEPARRMLRAVANDDGGDEQLREAAEDALVEANYAGEDD